MTTLAKILWPEERAVARPPERLSVSAWCDRYRILDALNCARPGPWETSFAPYLREILDSVADYRCARMVLMGSTQWGKTESLINALLWTIAENPQPTLYVMPSEADVLSFNNRRLKGAIEASPRVRRHRTAWKADWKGGELAFDGMVLYFAWAHSAARLSSRSIGLLLLDEVDKYPRFSGREADPISLAIERQRWFPDAKALLVSTPTTTDGYIWEHWQQSDRRWFHVPCPFCGVFQALRFSRETLRFPPDERDPQRIREGRLATYVCASCEREIPDDDDHKRRMLAAGVWCPEGGEVTPAGKVRGCALDRPIRGYHVNALYSPMLSWSDVAAQFLASRGDLAKQMNFQNSWVGWPWIERATEMESDTIAARARPLPEGIVPRAAVVLTAGVDVQKGHMYYAVRAHGVGERSVTIEARTVESWEALAARLVHGAFPVEGEGEGEGEESMPVRLVCIDSGYRTDEVYEFCARYPDVCRPTKGQQSQAVPYTSAKLGRDWVGRAGGMRLWSVDTSYYKDKLVRQIRTPHGAPSAWSVHAEPTEEFCAQMTSEHKILERAGRRKAVAHVWRVKPGASANHWWDCEVLNAAAADMLGVFTLQDDTTEAGVSAYAERARQPRAERRERPERDPPRFRRKRGGGFIRRRGER